MAIKTTKTKKKSTKKKSKMTKKKRIKRLILKIFLISTISFTLLLGSFFFSIYIGLFGKIPSYSDLKKIKNDETSKIYSDDNLVINSFYLENRTNIGYNKISKNVFDALISTEDSRFYEHSGIDTRSLLRVLFKTVLLRDKSSGGGSTLSQQLAKNLFGRKRYSFLSMPINKFKEMITAHRLESIYTKEEVITLYLNTVPFGEDVYGIESASQRFFSKSAQHLSLTESATLVGMLKASTAYNPRMHPKKSKYRRNIVLHQMLKYGAITKGLYKYSIKQPLEVKYKRLNFEIGSASYLRERIRKRANSILKEYNQENGTNLNLYIDGLKIYTTIDSRLQKYAEEAVCEYIVKLQKSFNKHWARSKPWTRHRGIIEASMKRSIRYKKLKRKGTSMKKIREIFNKKIKMEVYAPKYKDTTLMMSPLDSIKYYQMILHSGLLAMNPTNGYIKAWVGGIDFKYFKYDMIMARRQTGSIFKPIVYATALENGEPLNSYYENKKTIYKKYNNWSPKNSHKDDEIGSYSMKGALAHSINTIAVELLMKAGFTSTISMAHEMGMKSKLNPFPSLALGVANSSLYEMVQVYSTFANNGMHVEPSYIKLITDKEGNVIYKADIQNVNRCMSQPTASAINYMLQATIDEGTGRRLRTRYGLKNSLAGKTGTTQNNADGWFIGYTPKIVVGVRTGAEDMRVHFRSTYLGQGANTALPIFGLFMKKALRDRKFNSWNYAQFPGLPASMIDKINIPTRKKDSFFKKTEEKIKNIFKVKKDKKKKKKSIWKRIKSIFSKD